MDGEKEKLDETGMGNPLLSRDLIEEMILSEEVIFRGRVFFFLGIKMINMIELTNIGYMRTTQMYDKYLKYYIVL